MPAATGDTQPARGQGNGAFAFALLDPDIEIPDGVTDATGSPAPKRYGVYRNNVVVGLMEALKSAYPSLHAIMGEENFSRVVRNFIVAHPPRAAMMQSYGAGFADFLDAFEPLRKSPFLGDAARLERAWLEAYHAADIEPLKPGDLEGLAGEALMRLRLSAHPAAFLMRSDWPVCDLFSWRDGRPPNGADLSKGQCVAVSRPCLQVRMEPIEAAMFVFLNCMLKGSMLGEAVSAAIEEDAGFDVSAGLALMMSSGLFVKPVSVPD